MSEICKCQRIQTQAESSSSSFIMIIIVSIIIITAVIIVALRSVYLYLLMVWLNSKAQFWTKNSLAVVLLFVGWLQPSTSGSFLLCLFSGWLFSWWVGSKGWFKFTRETLRGDFDTFSSPLDPCSPFLDTLDMFPFSQLHLDIRYPFNLKIKYQIKFKYSVLNILGHS